RLYVAEECVAERDRDDSTASQLVGIFACQSGHHGCELRLRPCRWHLVLKSTNHVDRAQQPVCEPLPIDDERHKNVGILKHRGAWDTRWGSAHRYPRATPRDAPDVEAPRTAAAQPKQPWTSRRSQRPRPTRGRSSEQWRPRERATVAYDATRRGDPATAHPLF